MIELLERYANLALAGIFGALFGLLCAFEEWMWRRRMKQKMRGLMRML